MILLLPALLAPAGLRVSVCFCWQGGGASADAVLEGVEGPASIANEVAAAAGHAVDRASHGCACCCSARHDASDSNDDEREAIARLEPAPCPGCHVFEHGGGSFDRSKPETVDLDPQLLALVVFAEDVVPTPVVARTRCRTPELRRPIGRTPGAMPLRI